MQKRPDPFEWVRPFPCLGCILCKVTKLFLDGETPEGQDALIELVERGWIGRNRLNKDTYFLATHSLIRQLILNELAPSVDECSAFFAQLERSFTDFVELLEETGYPISTSSSHPQQRETERSRRGTPCCTDRCCLWLLAGCVR